MFSIYNILKKLSFILSPPFCNCCRKFINERNIFCNECFEKIKPIVTREFQINKVYRIKVIAISDYQEPLKSLILAKKRGDYLASKNLGELIGQMTNLKNIPFDCIVPIPLHWSRQMRRGYNQVEVIANEISKQFNKPVKNILSRSRKTAYQATLDKKQRLTNVKDAFNLKNIQNIEEYKDQTILIVDDLFTTGSTLFSAANEICKLKPKAIIAVVGCRVI